jgi:hypothetical protein
LKAVAWRYQVGRTVHLCASQLDHYFSVDEGDSYIKGSALCLLTEAQSALSAQAATIAQLEARLHEAEAVIRDHNAGCESQCEQRQQNGTASCPYAQYGRQCPDCPRDWLLDAAIAAHGKDGAHADQA